MVMNSINTLIAFIFFLKNPIFLQCQVHFLLRRFQQPAQIVEFSVEFLVSHYLSEKYFKEYGKYDTLENAGG